MSKKLMRKGILAFLSTASVGAIAVSAPALA